MHYVRFKVYSRVVGLRAALNTEHYIWLNLGYAGVSLVIAGALIAATIFTYKTYGDREKGSPFECGFDPVGEQRLPFCMKFFVIRIIFLVFDVEATLVLPLIYANAQVSTFLWVLVVGFLYEWSYGGLRWMV